MFGLRKDAPLKKLQKEHARKLEAARDAQRGGDIQRYAKLMGEADELERKMDAIDSQDDRDDRDDLGD